MKLPTRNKMPNMIIIFANFNWIVCNDKKVLRSGSHVEDLPKKYKDCPRFLAVPDSQIDIISDAIAKHEARRGH